MTVATLSPATQAGGTAITTPTSKRAAARPRPRPKIGPVGRGRHPLPATGHVRLTRRGRALSSVAALLALAVIGFGLVHAFAPAEPAVVGSRTVVVQPGQTAWEIAESVNPAVDPRITLSALRDLNELTSAGLLAAGQRLVVPVYARGS
jgi:hypothetical protein